MFWILETELHVANARHNCWRLKEPEQLNIDLILRVGKEGRI
jgi:hypothetical protein